MRDVRRFVIAVIMVQAVGCVARAGVLFMEGFEDGDMAGWTDAGATCTETITNTTAAEGGTHSMQITGAGMSNFQGRYHTLVNLTPGYISVWIRPGIDSAAQGYFVIGDDDIKSNLGIIFFGGNSAGDWVIYDTTAHSLGAYVVNHWTHIEFLLNWGLRTVDVCIDGTSRISGVAFRSSTTTCLTQVHLYNYDAVTAWFDELFMEDVVPTATPTRTGTARPTASSTATPTATSTCTPTATATPTAFPTWLPQPTPPSVSGAILSWGQDDYGQVSGSPSGNDFVGMAGGGYHSLALKSDGSIVSWGSDVWGQVSRIPSGNDFVAIGGGSSHSLAWIPMGRVSLT